jgi:hypothetical protein
MFRGWAGGEESVKTYPTNSPLNVPGRFKVYVYWGRVGPVNVFVGRKSRSKNRPQGVPCPGYQNTAYSINDKFGRGLEKRLQPTFVAGPPCLLVLCQCCIDCKIQWRKAIGRQMTYCLIVNLSQGVFRLDPFCHFWSCPKSFCRTV